MIHRLIPRLIKFLDNPVVHIMYTPSAEVLQLRSDLEAANETIAQLRLDLKHLESKFMMSAELNLVYMDLLNQHGIPHRHLRQGDSLDPVIATESSVTVVCECAAVLESYLPALLDGLEHIYSLGLFTVGVACAGTVCLILYGVIGKI